MNKQEKQELVNQLNSRLSNCPSGSWDKGYNEGLMNAVIVVRNMHTADEPQKVKVPAFVAKWIELCKEKADAASCLNGYYEIGNGTIVRPRGFSEEFYDWLADCDHMDALARAWLDGYEVEEEPLYTVTINLDLNYHLALDEGDGYDEISTTLTTGHDVLGYRYFLTEKEIKSADENLWPFAVPAEKVEV